MYHVHELIRQHGDFFYLITFVWTALEGETFVIFAGLAAQRGLLNPWLLFWAAWWGSMFGDQMFFFIGRFFGSHILTRFPKIEPKLAPVFNALEKYATGFILSYRFMYGVRNVSGIAVGMSRLPWRRFAITNMIASFIWAVVFCGSGYLFGDVLKHYAGSGEGVNDQIRNLMLAILAIFVFLVVLRIVVMKLHNKKAP
jgi:membrane protein DedA with SNARE-associated domain